MGNLVRDARYASRLLISKPVYTGVALLSLALGIGVNISIFSIVNEFFLRPLPVEATNRLVAVYTLEEQNPGFRPLSHLNWRDLSQWHGVFSSVFGYDWARLSVAPGGGDATVVYGQLVSGNFFDALGIKAILGRTFAPEEDATPGTHPVVVLSHRFWTNRLGGEPGVLGEPLLINGQPFTIVGVVAENFGGLEIGVEPEVWVPMSMNFVIRPDAEANLYDERRGLFIYAFARLQGQVSLDEARAALQLFGDQLARDYPEDNAGRRLALKPLVEATIVPRLRGGMLRGTRMLAVVAGVVLLIACGNVANLLLTRADERRREIAVRLAMGASRRRLVRQLLTETLVLFLAGGALAVLFALWARLAMNAYLEAQKFQVAVSLSLNLDWRVLGFALGLALITALAFGLVPALQATRLEQIRALKGGGELRFGRRRQIGGRQLLVICQLALSMIALLGAGLFLRSLESARQSDLGYDSDRLLAVSFDLGLLGYEAERGKQWMKNAIDKVKILPGIESAGLTLAGPLQRGRFRTVNFAGRARDKPIEVQTSVADPGYFEVLGLRVTQGRGILETDREDSIAVTVVNETMAKRFWPGESPVGQSIDLSGAGPVEVIGVVEDIRYNALREDAQPYAYLPFAQLPSSRMTLVARTSGSPDSRLPAVQRKLRALEPDLPFIHVGTVEGIINDALWASKMGVTLMLVLGSLALILATIGIYGVLSFSITSRRREIGIRMALGAVRGRIVFMVLREVFWLTAFGLATGVLLAVVLRPLVAALLYVSPFDPVVVLIAVTVLTLVALVACLLPTRRATQVSPSVALRYD